MPDHEIEEIRDRLAENLKPQAICLFGSYADGTYTDESDFYIVVSDDGRSVIISEYFAGIRYRRICHDC